LVFCNSLFALFRIDRELLFIVVCHLLILLFFANKARREMFGTDQPFHDFLSDFQQALLAAYKILGPCTQCTPVPPSVYRKPAQSPSAGTVALPSPLVSPPCSSSL